MEVESGQPTLLSRLAEGAAEVAGAAAAEGAHGVDARAAVLTGISRALVHVRLTPQTCSHGGILRLVSLRVHMLLDQPHSRTGLAVSVRY